MSRDPRGSARAGRFGPLRDLLDKLDGPEGDLWHAALQRFLCRQNPWSGGEASAPMPLATPWPTRIIRIGGKGSAELLADIDGLGFRVEVACRELLSTGVVSTEPQSREVRLVEITPRHLGFTNSVHWQPLRDHARLHGLAPCPAEVGPHLLLRGGDGWRVVMMEPLRDGRGAPVLFRVGPGVLQASDVRQRKAYRGISSKEVVVFLLAGDSTEQ